MAKACKVLEETQAISVQAGPAVLPVRRALGGQKERAVLLGTPAEQGCQERKETTESLAMAGLLVRPVLLVPPEIQVQLDCQASQDHPDKSGPLDPLDPLARPDPLVMTVVMEMMVSLVVPDFRVTLGPMGHQARQEILEHRGEWELPE